MNQYSIMLVDDSEIDRYILKRSIENIKNIEDILEAENGQEAIEFLEDYHARIKKYKERFPPIIIFLDINMPLLDGFGFLKMFDKLRTIIDQYKKTHIFMYSSSENIDDQTKVSKYKFVHDFVVKGQCDSEQIQEKIENILANAA